MLRQSQQLKQLQKLSPQQIQLMKLLQLPTIALEQRIKEEMEINPALEEGETEDDDEESNNEEDELETNEEGEDENDDLPEHDEDFALTDYMDDDEGISYKEKVNNTSADDERREVPFASGISFQDMLESQLGLKDLNDHEYQVGLYLIGNIDEDGYMRRELDAIVDDMAFSQNIITTKEELEKVLKTIHEFDPPGVGARDLQECLLIQLLRKSPQNQYMGLAVKIVKECMEEFSKKHYEKIAKKLEINDDTLKNVIHEITRLNPKPGSAFTDAQKNMEQVIPDFVLHNTDGELELSLNSRNLPELKVSRLYGKMADEYSRGKDKQSKEAVMFIKQKIDSAKWFIDAIEQRNQTLLLTMNAIVEHQKDYFMEGDETLLKPMILKDIAEKINMDISTVSRVANSKYVQTPFGTFLLKSFFSESLSTDSGEEVSTREVKKILQDCISAEDKKKPLTDDRLCEILREKGYNIARRTVAKYREQLEIPVARMRKEL